jgi:transcriptional regulator with XRE-family HTH domain
MSTPAIEASRPATAPAGRQNEGGPRQACEAMPGTSTRNWRFLTVDKPYDIPIGPLLLRLRTARSYSQDQLAQLLCAVSGMPTITRVEVSRWERHDRIPSAYWLQWLAQVLGIPLDVLRQGVAVARQHRHTDPTTDGDAGGSTVSSWLTLHHGPREVVIALGGVEVDQLRTVLAPVNPDPCTNTRP